MSTVIVLNGRGEYCNEVSIRKVLKWYSAQKINIMLSDETEEIGSVTDRIKRPYVVMIPTFHGYKPKSEKIPFSQEAVFYRDNNVCQYYHRNERGQRFRFKCDSENRTIDHVIPLSQGGRNDFLNCVCACRHCNEVLKKNKTPREAGLELIRIPVIPHRNRNEFVITQFTFNPKKLSHQKYVKEVLGQMAA